MHELNCEQLLVHDVQAEWVCRSYLDPEISPMHDSKTAGDINDTDGQTEAANYRALTVNVKTTRQAPRF
jgi:hypothetical protein